MLSPLTLETMQPLLNDPFVLHMDPTKSIDIQLVEVSAIKTNNQFSWQKQEKPIEKKPFTLVFRTPPNFETSQKSYEISHHQLGDLGMIFLVPITQDDEGLYLEAVFT